ncbi:hypothetical protein EYF80_015273 [Liparis tanakae]|uniref:Secreted protein n=1 Tax=Liparis tanakae TaxID=230148 RepID=A0A4Z2IBL7_9TELE|nr:hypothetical protein EYF80_015273 [Liparis tanakae]
MSARSLSWLLELVQITLASPQSWWQHSATISPARTYYRADSHARKLDLLCCGCVTPRPDHRAHCYGQPRPSRAPLVLMAVAAKQPEDAQRGAR